MKDAIVIAIDGPSASGKGTCSRFLAGKLGFAIVDTGAMYRTLTWYCLENGIAVTSPEAVLKACWAWPVRLERRGHHIHLVIEGRDPGDQIRSDRVSNTVPDIATVVGVRIWMVRTQRECVQFGDMIMDGRDIGTHVFPETPFKFFLTAAEDVRQRRRDAQGSRERTDIRDRKDQRRAVAPLDPARDAVIIDNSHENPEVTAEFMLAHFLSRRRQLGL